MTINDDGEAATTEPPSAVLLTHLQVMERLHLKPAHFSKLTNGKIRGLPPLLCVRIGRRQLFRPETLASWIREVEGP